MSVFVAPIHEVFLWLKWVGVIEIGKRGSGTKDLTKKLLQDQAACVQQLQASVQYTVLYVHWTRSKKISAVKPPFKILRGGGLTY